MLEAFSDFRSKWLLNFQHWKVLSCLGIVSWSQSGRLHSLSNEYWFYWQARGGANQICPSDITDFPCPEICQKKALLHSRKMECFKRIYIGHPNRLIQVCLIPSCGIMEVLLVLPWCNELQFCCLAIRLCSSKVHSLQTLMLICEKVLRTWKESESKH